MYVRLLGAIEARLDERPIPLGPPKQRAVLAMLALQAGRTVSADRLAEGLWGEQPPASASKMVQLYVSQLRRLFAGDGAEIVTRGRGYELRLTDGAVDAVEFERLLEQDRGRDALALWHGEPLADVADEPFAAAEIRRLDELRVRAAEAAIDADLEAGRHDKVIGELEALIEEHPLRERLHAQRMLALYRAGRQAEALNAYREARSVLVEQIGVEPGAELRRLQEAILAQDPALDLASPSPPAEAPPAARPPRPRAVPVLAVAGLLLFAGVLAFGISRVTQPDSLDRIDEDHVGLIDPDGGRITAQYRVGHGPEAMTAGAGSVWVANRVDGTVSRIDRGREEVLTIDVGGEPTGLAFGAGWLWVADGQGRTVAQIDPGVSKVVQRYVVGNAAHAVAVGFGAVWVASAVDAAVVKINAKSGRVTKRIGVEARPTALAAGAEAIWVVSEATARVIRLDPRTGTPLDSIPVGNGPSGVAVGAGAVWVTNRIDGTVYRIDLGTDAVTEAVRVGREPRAVAAGEDGVWVANAGEGTVMRIDPRDREVTDTVPIDSSPAALAAADGTVWTAALAATATHRGGTLRVSHMVPLPAEPSLIDPAYFYPAGGACLRRPGRLPASRRLGGRDAGGESCRRPAGSEPRRPDLRVQAAPEHPLLQRRAGQARGRPRVDRAPAGAAGPGLQARCASHTRSGTLRAQVLRPLAGHRDRPGNENRHDPSEPAGPRVPGQARLRLHRAGREPGARGDHETAAGHGAVHDRALGPAARRAAGPQPALRRVVARPARRLPGSARHAARPAASAARGGRPRRRGHRPASSRDPRRRSAPDAVWRAAAHRPQPRPLVGVPQRPHPAVR
jgi:YVTN family beta-propeller protein